LVRKMMMKVHETIFITGRSEVGTPAFLKFWYKIL
jgi:hypothetical protein